MYTTEQKGRALKLVAAVLYAGAIVAFGYGMVFIMLSM